MKKNKIDFKIKGKKFDKNKKFKKGTPVPVDKFANGRNNISWYSKDPLLIKQASLVNFLQPIGEEFKIFGSQVKGKPTLWTGNSNLANQTLPGVMSLTWFPTPGISKDPTSPCNVAMAKLFTTMRVKNFSTSVYDPADVMMYVLAWDSIFALYAWMTLVYSHATEFVYTNRYYPKAILEAMGVDYNDIVDNLDAFLVFINYIRNKINVTKVPKAFKFIEAHMHMSANVYKDAEIEKSQLYVFTPLFLWEYDATVPELKQMSFYDPNTPMTFNMIKTKAEQLLNAVVNDEDMNIIAADIIKFVGGDTWSVEPIDWWAQVQPIYDHEMLYQIHNADFLSYSSANDLRIYQDVDANLNTIIKFDPTFTSNSWCLINNKVIDSSNNDPSPEEVVESTRLKFTIDDVVLPTTGTAPVAPSFTFKLTSCGASVIANAIVVQSNGIGGYTKTPFHQFININIGDLTQFGGNVPCIGFECNPLNNNDPMLLADGLSALASSAFDYLPIRQLGCCAYTSATTCEYVFLTLLGEIGNLTIIQNEQLKVLHEICMLSLLDIGDIR